MKKLKFTTQENLQLLENILSHVPGHIYWKDKRGVFLGCNDEQARSAGLKSRHDIIGKTDYELPWKEQAEILRNSDTKVMETGKTIVFEEPSILANGKKAIFLSKKVPLRDKNNEIIGVLGISVDITELKNAEEELRKANDLKEKENKAKSKFLKILQHSLRNNLTGILSCSDLLLDFMDDKETIKKALIIIRESSEKIIPMLDRISNYLSLDAGYLTPYNVSFSLRHILNSYVSKFEKELKGKELEIQCVYDKKLNDRFLGDVKLICDILDNLVSNAVKYTKQGKITIRTYFVQSENENIWFDILIEDSGIGIQNTIKNKLFTLFEYDKKDEDGRYITPGINLSISKKISELLGGNLIVESKTGIGTTFTLQLRLKALEEDSEKKLITQDEFRKIVEKVKGIKSSKPFKENIIVLVVEDDVVNLQCLKALLSTYFRCEIISSMDLKTAKQIIMQDSQKFDLVLTDIGLPDGEGYEIVDYLKCKYPEDALPLVVAITAYAREIDVDQICDKGISYVIPKPISLDSLSPVITAAFGEEIRKKDVEKIPPEL